MSAAARAVYLVCLVYLVLLVEQNQINETSQINQKDQMNQLSTTRREMVDGAGSWLSLLERTNH